VVSFGNSVRIRSHYNVLSGFERSCCPTTSRHRSNIVPLNLPSDELATVVLNVNVEVNVRISPSVAAYNSFKDDLLVFVKDHGAVMRDCGCTGQAE